MLDSSLADHALAPRLLLASGADVPFIVDTIVAESRHGHFNCDSSRPDLLRGLWHQVQAIVIEGVAPMPGARNLVGARAFVVQVGRANAAFAILAEHAPGSWHERLELFAMATHTAHRGRGLARHAVTSLTRDADSALVYARCAPASTGMAALLRGCGFADTGSRLEGAAVLEWRRAVER